MELADDERDVFVNCPFDSKYQRLFNAVVFCVWDCGFRVRCALEVDDSSRVRIERIVEIIGQCKYGIHDISRTQLDPGTRLPRFNMPLELGIFLGAQRFGGEAQREKVCLIMDADKYRYQKFISDIAGQDIQAHANDPEKAIGVVRNWLRTSSGRKDIPGGAEVNRRYLLFQRALPGMCRDLKLRRKELTFADLTNVIEIWLRANA